MREMLSYLNWNDFVEYNRKKYQRLPEEYKAVLVKIINRKTRAVSAVAGYLKFASGDKQSPYFICLGVNGDWEAIAWCDCLPQKGGTNND